MRRRRPTVALALAAVAALLAAGCAGDDDGEGGAPSGTEVSPATDRTGGEGDADDEEEGATQAAPLDEVPCAELIEGFPAGIDATCGTVAVPLDHESGADDGDSVEIAVAVLSATGEATADPLLVLAGGPGEPLLPSLTQLTPDSPLAALGATRDVVWLDQRGAGLSTPSLACPEVDEAIASLALTADEAAALAAVQAGAQACRDRLVDDEGVDLSSFDTEANVEDLEAVRQALGYDTWDVFGTSYGARLALQYQRDHAEVIGAAALSSPIPADANFLLDAGTAYADAVDAVFEACAADADCDAANPDLPEVLSGVLEELEQAPVPVPVPDPAGNEPVELPISAATVSTLLFTLFYAPDAVAAIPALVTQLGQGDFDAFAEAGGQSAGLLQISLGMYYSFVCAEEAADTTAEEVEEQAADLPAHAAGLVTANTSVGLPAFELCELWDVEAEADVFEPFESDVPNLVVTGTFDQITTPAYADDLADSLTEATFVEVPAGHSPLLASGECGIDLLLTFLDDPTADLDTSCVPDELEFVSDTPAG